MYGYDVSDFSYFSPAPRNIQPKIVGIYLFSHAISKDPQQFFDDVRIPKWESAMLEKYSSLMNNHTWDLIPLPKGQKLVHCKWVYRTKYVADGTVDKYKAQLVAKGFS